MGLSTTRDRLSAPIVGVRPKPMDEIALDYASHLLFRLEDTHLSLVDSIVAFPTYRQARRSGPYKALDTSFHGHLVRRAEEVRRCCEGRRHWAR